MSTSKRNKPATIDDIIENASPAERVAEVCVAGKLVAEYQRLEAEMAKVEAPDNPAGQRLGSPSDSNAAGIAQKMREVAAQMREATYEFRFRALPAKKWSDLVAKHPDKSGKFAFNRDTFPPALIAACCVEPEGMDDTEKVEALLERLSSAQQGDLFDAAWEVNTAAPKEMTSFVASAVLRASEKN